MWGRKKRRKCGRQERGGKEGKREKEQKNEFYETSVNHPSLFYCWTSFCRLYLQICESFLLSIFKRHHFSCQHRNWNKLIHFLYAAEWANVKHKLSPLVTMEGTVIVIWQSVPLLAPLTARYDKRCGPCRYSFVHVTHQLILWVSADLRITNAQQNSSFRKLLFFCQWPGDSHKAFS